MKILCIDDHPLVRGAIRDVLLKSELAGDLVWLEANDPDEGLQIAQAESRELDLILLDLNFPGRAPAFGELEALRRRLPLVPVAVISGSQEWVEMARAFRLGASGFLLKTMTPEQLAAAIQVVLSGLTFAPRELLDARLEDASARERTHGAGEAPNPPAQSASPPLSAEEQRMLGALTDRQVEVLKLLCEGKSAKHIARCLTLSFYTVKSHLATIYRTLEVTNKVEAAARGIRLLRARDHASQVS